tara:strand:+ start:177 stop:446 length:270 start_codon:yes stop_codon:yes gene_type:complete
MFSIFGRLFAKSIQEKNNDAEKTAITLNILRTQWKEVKRDRHSLVIRNKTPNTDPLLFKKIEEREKKILERFNKLTIDDETLKIADLEY